jgi:predicted esterase
MARLRPVADKYGMIVLAGNAATPGRWDVLAGMIRGQTVYDTTTQGFAVSQFPEQDVQTLDTALAYVLHTQAIDPDRIALTGFSDGGSYSLFLGQSNEDIFSRVAALSALIPFTGTGPHNPKTQFLVSGGIAEEMVQRTVKLAQVLRHEGHSVATILSLRGHVDRVEEEDFVWQWLQRSWADPTSTARFTAPADSDPILTDTILTQLTTFWTRFQQEPDSIRTTARQAHQIQIPLMLGAEPVSVVAMDLPALATMYPSIAADLRAAGLTAQQAMAYRNAVLRVGFARAAGMAPNAAPATLFLGHDLPFTPIAPTSVLGQNLAFRRTHDTAFQALGETWMWTTP